MNTNYIIIGVVVLAIVGGGIWWSQSGSGTPDPEVLEQGVKNLTREAAAAKIKQYLQLNPQTTGYYGFNTQTQHYQLLYKKEEDNDVKVLRRLVTEGYVTIISEKVSYGILEFQYDFTDKATPYLKNVSSESTYKHFVRAEVVSVEVTGITEPIQGAGGNGRIANYTATYEQTPVGKVVDGESTGLVEMKSQIPFILYDDGWRIQ